jgi:hypothetical protein
MCAGCPGGRAVSRLAAYVNLRGIKAEVARLLQQAAGSRASVSAFGDRWILRSPTGRQQVLADLEHLAGALVAGGMVDWNRLRKSAETEPAGMQGAAGGGTPVPGPDGRFELIRSLPAGGELPEMTAAEFTLALLGHAHRQHGGGATPGGAVRPPR